MHKIIALSGTHGTGKSTSAYTLCAKMKAMGYSVIVLDELARMCPFPINKGGDTRTSTWLITKQISLELEMLDKYDYIIVDRGLMDSYSYAMALGDFSAEVFYHVITNHIGKYYKKIYVPHPDSFNYQVADGTRDLDPVFRSNVFNELLRAYKKYNIHHTIIHTPEEMYNEVLTFPRRSDAV